MSGRAEWMIYGANGYTGHLVAAEARRRGLNPVLAGRRADPIGKLATELGLSMRVFDLDDPPAAAAAIADTAVVANCAGPFAATSAPMIDACLRSRAHYLDITGEIDVFLAAQRRHADAQAARIGCYGAAGEVNTPPALCQWHFLNHPVPAHPAAVLSEPQRSRHRSRGTRAHGSSRIEREYKVGCVRQRLLEYRGHAISRNGHARTNDAIPWGDLATAWFSTGIPNIETYAVVPRAAAIASRALNWVRPFLASTPGQMLLTWLANRASGPSEEQLRTGRSRLAVERGPLPPAALDRLSTLLQTFSDEPR